MRRLLSLFALLAGLTLTLGREARASFYDNYLTHAIAACPGFIGGSAEMSIEVPFSSWGEARHRYESTCYEPIFGSKKTITPFFSTKTTGRDDNPYGPDDDDDGKKLCRGSIINPLTASVGERVPVIGTTFDLVYFSSRTFGKVGKRRVRIPLNDSNGNVTGYKLDAEYAGGRTLSASFLNLPGQVYTFEWDGRDYSSDPVIGSIAFDFTVTVIAHGKEVPIHYKNFVGGVDASVFGFGGWTPSIYHFYDVVRGQLIRGDGTAEKLAAKTIGGGDLMVPEPDASVVHIFNSSGRHLYTKYGLTGANKYVFAHDGNGLLTTITEPYGQVVTLTVTTGRITQIASAKGQITSLAYGDPDGMLRSVTDPSGARHQMKYYESGLIERFTKPGGQSNAFYYDSDGKLTKDFHPSGFYQDLETTYDPVWKVPKVILKSRGGLETTFGVFNIYQGYGENTYNQIDPGGYLLKVRSRPDSRVEQYPKYSIEQTNGTDVRFPENARFP
ncbi:MAG TPA: hypothetical protein PKC28_12970, partial [Bdellovibrionales bacterium]|nr:hypothetical protein [Bdellovibrionales bacterium]